MGERLEFAEKTETDASNPFIPKFESFLNEKCIKDIQRLVENYPQKRSLSVDFKDIELFDFELADELLINPDYVLEAANEAIKNIDVPALELENFAPHIRVFNLPQEQQPLLRNISAAHLGKLILVEGVVGQLTEVLPKLKIATWECTRCGNTYKIPQSEHQSKPPYICECKHRSFNLVAEDSEFVDYQKIKTQEPLEKLKGSEIAATLDIFASDDLVNQVSPGAKTRITGILRLLPPKDKKTVYGKYLEAVHIEETMQEFDDIEITPEDEKEIRELAAKPDIYELLVKSVAPTIYGHETIKEAISLQLFGGVKKILPGESKIRGNIHVLLVGDPGLAKSQILTAVHNIAPKSIYIAGKTTTGAGISATAVKDDFGEGGWTLKAGALVLANGGICLIDELDKMDAEDRSALHESLEQQKISVAKAGIVTTFKTETSVLSAANPKFSRFDQYTSFIEQINLPPTLISRFDLFFMMKDVLDRKKDEDIAKHILKTHQIGEKMWLERKMKKKMSAKDKEELERSITPAINLELFKKYLSYARQNIFPVLTQESIQALSDFYIGLRDQGRKEGNYAATHRQLEGLVRLSEASARVRLSDVVELKDTERAIRLVKTSLQEVVTDPETGKIDIDIITSGQTHTQITNLKKILRIIKDKSSEIDDGMVPIEDVIGESKTEGIDSDKVREILTKLEKAGDIYRPRHGVVKPTSKR